MGRDLQRMIVRQCMGCAIETLLWATGKHGNAGTGTRTGTGTEIGKHGNSLSNRALPASLNY